MILLQRQILLSLGICLSFTPGPKQTNPAKLVSQRATNNQFLLSILPLEQKILKKQNFQSTFSILKTPSLEDEYK